MMRTKHPARYRTLLRRTVNARMVTIGTVTLVALLTLAVGLEQVVMHDPELRAAVVRSVIVERTNENRALNGSGLLRTSPLLEAAAQGKAKDMATRGYFAHVSPDGRTPWYWFDLVGYRFTHAGENLAVRFSDSDAVVQAWMGSEGHRANILNTNFTEVGIGIAQGVYQGRETLFVVQLFGTPRGTTTTVALAGTSTKAEGVKRDGAQNLALVAGAEGISRTSTSLFERAAASPRTAFGWLYLALGVVLLIVVVLIVLSGHNRRRSHRVLIVILTFAFCAACVLAVTHLFVPETVITDPFAV
jgi:uncharacterized protein YkwD